MIMNQQFRELVRKCIEADARQVQFMALAVDALQNGCSAEEVVEVLQDAIVSGREAIHRNTALLAALDN